MAQPILDGAWRTGLRAQTAALLSVPAAAALHGVSPGPHRRVTLRGQTRQAYRPPICRLRHRAQGTLARATAPRRRTECTSVGIPEPGGEWCGDQPGQTFCRTIRPTGPFAHTVALDQTFHHSLPNPARTFSSSRHTKTRQSFGVCPLAHRGTSRGRGFGERTSKSVGNDPSRARRPRPSQQTITTCAFGLGNR